MYSIAPFGEEMKRMGTSTRITANGFKQTLNNKGF
jgi:hypothetical protein